MQTTTQCSSIARVNGIAVSGEHETLSPDELRGRTCTELLRQAAQSSGLLPADDTPGADGVISEQACAAIDALIERSVRVPAPSDEACRRHYDAHHGRYTTGEKVRLRHILFAVTPGVNVNALRSRAESVLIDVRAHAAGDDPFPEAARKNSNCPSGAHGGDLGWLTADEVAPEFARALFGRPDMGVLPLLVHSRFGLHVIEVLAREPGALQPFDTVRNAIEASLRQQSFATALRQYISLLAGQAVIEGVDLAAAGSPLVQ